jgi:hypothetical protein
MPDYTVTTQSSTWKKLTGHLSRSSRTDGYNAGLVTTLEYYNSQELNAQDFCFYEMWERNINNFLFLKEQGIYL